MFVKLTRKDDGRAVYVNAAQVRGVAEQGGVTWVNMGEMAYQVVESAKTVVTLLEAAMNGGFIRDPLWRVLLRVRTCEAEEAQEG